MTRKEMPIFTRTFDFLSWLLPATNHFPRAQRHSFTRRLLDAAFDLRERLEEANLRRGQERFQCLVPDKLNSVIFWQNIFGPDSQDIQDFVN